MGNEEAKLKKIRWKQRFQNFSKAYKELDSAISKQDLSSLERAGLVKTFEFTFELAWKTLKDFLESEGVDCATPRETIKKSFQAEFIANGDQWLDALDKRNLLSHTYSEELSALAEKKIKTEYFPMLNQFYQVFLKK